MGRTVVFRKELLANGLGDLDIVAEGSDGDCSGRHVEVVERVIWVSWSLGLLA